MANDFMNIIKKYPNIEVISIVGNYLRSDTIIEMEKLVKNYKQNATLKFSLAGRETANIVRKLIDNIDKVEPIF